MIKRTTYINKRNAQIRGKYELYSENTASVESGRSGTGRYLSGIEKSGQAYL